MQELRRVNSEIKTYAKTEQVKVRFTDQPTNQQTDTRAHREVTYRIKAGNKEYFRAFKSRPSHGSIILGEWSFGLQVVLEPRRTTQC